MEEEIHSVNNADIHELMSLSTVCPRRRAETQKTKSKRRKKRKFQVCRMEKV